MKSRIQPFEKAKICEEFKIKRIKGWIADKALADTLEKNITIVSERN